MFLFIRIALQLIICAGSFCSCIWQGNLCPCQDKDRIWITRNVQRNQNKSTMRAPQVHHKCTISAPYAQQHGKETCNPVTKSESPSTSHALFWENGLGGIRISTSPTSEYRLSIPLELLLVQALGSQLPAMNRTKKRNVRKCQHSSPPNELYAECQSVFK